MRCEHARVAPRAHIQWIGEELCRRYNLVLACFCGLVSKVVDTREQTLVRGQKVAEETLRLSVGVNLMGQFTHMHTYTHTHTHTSCPYLGRVEKVDALEQ